MMADGRQRAEWVRAASLTVCLMAKPVDPYELIPERYRPAPAEGRGPRPRTEEEERLESELALRLLGRALEQVGTRNG
jgi:hypothetical protein